MPAIKKAMHAHTDLTVFGAVIAILEGGCLYEPLSNEAAQQIIKICKREQQRHIRAVDAALTLQETGKQQTHSA
ncbi:hypothetical protein CAL20_02740 [Bordetella genomosp. 4]|uniref:Transposase n=1 Tax=Bordetella genomosp. 4 TaxID=463044 RepID=A0A261USI2_9BORD|nr:hypothetical protein CAL20_02740 [Bordetella genomosp. 4]